MIKAQQEGLHLNHFPDRDNSDQEDDEDDEGDDSGDTEGRESDNGDGPLRPGRRDDPHVEVPRFGDVLPPALHTQEFKDMLRERFQVGSFDEAIDQYVAVLETVTGWLEHE